MTSELRGTPTDQERVERRWDKALVSRILKDGVFEHDPAHPDTFRVYLSYGSKTLDCYVRKHKGEAGAILEGTATQPRSPNETSYLYLALHSALRGVANRTGKSVRYRLITSNEKLVEWAKTSGRHIFDWKDVRTVDDITEFVCDVSPTVSPRETSRRSDSKEERMLLWEIRKELTKEAV